MGPTEVTAPAVRHRLPDHLRSALANPWGTIYATADLAAALDATPGDIVAVGDVVTATLLSLGYTPRLAIIDGHTQRGTAPVTDADGHRADDPAAAFDHVVETENPPAVITQDAWAAVRDALNDGATPPGETTLLRVNGEEDLLAMPAFLLAAPGTKVLYGMPSRGAVLVRTDDALRQRVRELLAQMPSGRR